MSKERDKAISIVALSIKKPGIKNSDLIKICN